MKISTKILLIFSVLTVSIIFLMATFAYRLANKHSFEDFYKRLEIRAYIAARANLEQDKHNSTTYNEIRQAHLERLPFEREYFIQVFPGDNISDTGRPEKIPSYFFKEVLRAGKATFRNHNIFYEGIHYNEQDKNYIVIVSAQNEYGKEYLNDLRKVLLYCCVIAGVLLITAGLFFSRYILQPVRDITSQVKQIRAHNLHLRLPNQRSTDEISELSQTFNNMLDRLETAFETQNNFVSNASHELSTPLTAIIGEAELSLSKHRTADQYIQSLQVVLREAERLHHITKSLLSLAQTGFTTHQQQQLTPLRTDELVFTVKETVDQINPDNKVTIDFSMLPEDEDKLIVKGNNQLLQLALSNIVLNGCKYSDNQPVSIALAATDTHNIIIIKDYGIGIPQQDLPYIYEPFFRASNTHAYKGYGIGLPLARNIIRLHNGNIAVNSQQDQGTEIRITLPSFR